jgi:alkylation response protein AidB-like acyl-CoA dehydrogenase
MRLLPTPDALEFAAAVRDVLAKTCDADALRAAWDSDSGRVPGLWQRLADVGVTGLTVPVEHGGAGEDLTAAVPVLVECGRVAAPEPFAGTLAGVALLARAGGPLAAEWLPRVAAGDASLALGEGSPALLSGGAWADLALVAADDPHGVWAVRRDEASVTPAATIDRGHGLASFAWSGGTLVDGADGWAAFDTACVAVAAELVGLAQGMLDLAVSYARQREQFGVPIGSFQAVKHQLADVYVAASFALPVVHRAAWSVAHDLPSRARDASHAWLAAAAAAEQAARTALQVHGGIGYTYEHHLHMWMKRTWSHTSTWGGAALHRRRVSAALLGGDPPPPVPPR